MKRRLTSFFQTALLLVATASPWIGISDASVALACPFCSATSQTIRQETTSMDVVAFAKLIGSDSKNIDGVAQFEIVEVVKGDERAKVSNTLEAPYFGPGKSDKLFLVNAVIADDELLWSSPLTMSDDSYKYVQNLFKLSEDPTERLRFFINYLEHKEPLLAGDAYDEFALAPYAEVVAIKDAISHDKVWGWIEDGLVSPDRKRLYYTLLGIVAQDGDAERLEKKLRSSNPDERAGLDALIACYLTIRGDEGVPLIKELFLENTKVAYGDTYQAIMALRFQGNDGGGVSKEAILTAMRTLLDRPDYADLVIPDLARWEDWTQVDKLFELFKNSDASNSWVRVPVINYMRACPLPAAKTYLEEIKVLDPKSFQRASIFFPVQSSEQSQESTPTEQPNVPTNEKETDDLQKSQSNATRPDGDLLAMSSTEMGDMRTDTVSLFSAIESERRALKASGSAVAADFAAPARLSLDAKPAEDVNQYALAGVTALASLNLSLVMMFVMSGGSQAGSFWTRIRERYLRLFSS